MSLKHDFIVIKKQELQKKINDNSIFDEYLNISIHDEFILYFSDSLKWVSSTNPYNYDITKGLNYYSYTLFEGDQVEQFKSVISAWHNIFSNAPEKFTLRGMWTTIEGEENSGCYDTILVDKGELLSVLSGIIRYCEQIENDNNLVLLHWGV